jgi:hypothetical protein
MNVAEAVNKFLPIIVDNLRQGEDPTTVFRHISGRIYQGQVPSPELVKSVATEALKKIADLAGKDPGGKVTELASGARDALRQWALKAPSRAGEIAEAIKDNTSRISIKGCVDTLKGVAEALREGGMAEAEAFEAQLAEMAETVPLAREALQALGQNPAAAAATATAATGTATSLGGTSLGATLLSSLPAILAGLLVVGAVGAGGWMLTHWGKPSDEPVAAGPQSNRPRPTTPPATTMEPPVACGVAAPPPGFPYFFRGHATREDAIQDVKNNGRGRQFAITETCTSEEARQFGRYLVFWATP